MKSFLVTIIDKDYKKYKSDMVVRARTIQEAEEICKSRCWSGERYIIGEEISFIPDGYKANEL